MTVTADSRLVGRSLPSSGIADLYVAAAKAAAKPLGLSVRGTGGEHTPIGADGTVDISPSNRLFITEAEIVTKLYNGIKLLLEKEQAAAISVAISGILQKLAETEDEPELDGLDLVHPVEPLCHDIGIRVSFTAVGVAVQATFVLLVQHVGCVRGINH